MEENVDRLTAALQDIARADGARAPERPDPRVLAALPPLPASLHLVPSLPAGRVLGRQGRVIGLAIAATLVAALAGSLWSVGRPQESSREGQAARGEIVTAFMPLTYSALPYTNAQIVRLEVTRDALKNFGLAPADVAADNAALGTVLADVLVGEDGLARAVRFVRPERTAGVAP